MAYWLRLPAVVLTLAGLVAAGSGAAFAATALPDPGPGSAGVDLATVRSPATAAPPVAAGWQRVNLPDAGTYFLLYVPPGWNGTAALPLVVFLHGAGGVPEQYQSNLSPPAEGLGCLVAAPKSSSMIGWGVGNDEQIVAETATTVAAMVPVDPARVSIAGHSAGGAYAYLLAYGTVSRYSAVFTLSAPFYPVSGIANPAYTAPIHMYYGTVDPNYIHGDYAALVQQWDGLGVPWESDVEARFGHDDWPPISMLLGFQFLVGKTYRTCAADATHLCLQQARYRVELSWQDGNGGTGVGSVVPAVVSADSGVLWFFDPNNWEMLVKVLDGCAVNRRLWVFAAATTNVAYTLKVTDTVTGKARSYQNPGGQAAAVVTDTNAFDACP
jgi:hypothetical protein